MAGERTCMIIESLPVTRLGIRRVLEPHFSTEEARDGAEATQLLTSVGRVDVAVVEMRPPQIDGSPSGSSTIRDLLAAQPGLGIVAHGHSTDRNVVRDAIEAGASAYVSRHSTPNALLKAVDAACELERFIDPAAQRGGKMLVTRRQRQVMQMFADGLSNDEIGRRLGISGETVRTHAKACLARLGARDRAHAIALMLRADLIH